MNQREEELED